MFKPRLEQRNKTSSKRKGKLSVTGTRGFAEVNGTRLYYEIAGAGETIVLVHGFSVDTRMWDEQFDVLANNYRVVRYDMRGFGQSALPDGKAYDPCVDLLALIDFLSIDKASLVGLSLGGWVALDFVVAYPDRVKTLVCADAALMGFEWKNGRPSTLPVEVAQTRGVDAAKQYWMASSLFTPAIRNPRVLRKLDEMVSTYSGWHWTHENPQILADEPTIYNLKNITCPSLVLVGEHDVEDFLSIAEVLDRDIPDTEYFKIENAGHMSNMENPQRFNELLLAFFGRRLA